MSPRGHGNRITKPPSVKQQAHANRISQVGIVLAPADAGLPTCSWWTNLGREAFDAAVQREADRMKLSRLARERYGMGE